MVYEPFSQGIFQMNFGVSKPNYNNSFYLKGCIRYFEILFFVCPFELLHNYVIHTSANRQLMQHLQLIQKI